MRFNKDKNRENFYREQLMLYTPWRDEINDLIQHFATYAERYEKLKFQILQKRKQYEHNTDVLDRALEDLENNGGLCSYSDVAPNTQHTNERDQHTPSKNSKLYLCFEPGVNKMHCQYDLTDDMGIFLRTNDDDNLTANVMETDKCRALVCSLSREQMEFFYHVLHSVKTNREPLKLFLSGGAGVGKSTVTNALYEAVIIYLHAQHGENPNEIKVLNTTGWKTCEKPVIYFHRFFTCISHVKTCEINF